MVANLGASRPDPFDGEPPLGADGARVMRARPADSSAGPARRGGWPLVAVIAITSFIGTFDVTGVNVVLPQMASELHVDAAAVQWVSLGYLLPIAALALPAGRWLDTVGRRPALLLIVAGFAVSAAAAGASPNLPVLIAARALQGVFGAGLFAVASIVAFHALPVADRRRGIGVLSAAGAAGGVAGPAVGALIAQAWGWPWIFWLALPLLVGQLPALARLLPRDLPLKMPTGSQVVEGVLIGCATSAVLLGLTFTASGSKMWLLLTLGAIPFVALWYRLHPSSPIIDLMRRPGFALAANSRALLAAALLSVQYLLAFLAERTIHLTPAQTGEALLALPAATVVSALVAGRLPASRRPARPAAAGFAVITVGTLSALTASQLAGIVCVALLVGIGQGITNTSATHYAMSIAGDGNPASTGAALSLLWNLGSTIGPACVSAVWGGLGYSGAAMSAAFVVTGIFALGGGTLILLASRAAAR